MHVRVDYGVLFSGNVFPPDCARGDVCETGPGDDDDVGDIGRDKDMGDSDGDWPPSGPPPPSPLDRLRAGTYGRGDSGPLVCPSRYRSSVFR